MLKKFIGAAALICAAQVAAQAPSAPTLDFVFEEVVKLGPAVEVGATAQGKRRIIPITGGRFEGPGIKGEIVPGSWDWQLERGDGCTDVEANYFIKTDDGVMINVINKGPLCQGRVVRTHPVFEAPVGKYDWLSKNTFVGTLEVADPADGPAVKIRFYQVK